MLGISLLLHVALIAFIPGFGIFLPTGDIPYIEIETILLSPETEDKAETALDSETAKAGLGEFVVRSELSVSEPDRIERPDVIGEWERVVLEREVQVPAIPKIEEVPESRPVIDPEALAVQIELPNKVPSVSTELLDSFERPESVTIDDVTESAEQPFDIRALRGEDPPLEAEPEFKSRKFLERPENQAFLQPLTLAKASRTVASSPVAPSQRAFQQKNEPVEDSPQLQLPERAERLEAEEEILPVLHEEPHIVRQAELQPDSDDFPDFQARPLPEIVKSATLRSAGEGQTVEIRPADAAEPLPQQRNFRPKVLEKKSIESLPEIESSLPERDDSIVEVERQQTFPDRQEDRVVSQQDDVEPAFPLSFRKLVKSPPDAVVRSTASLSVARVEIEVNDITLNRPRGDLRVSSQVVGSPVDPGVAFERPAPPERSEEIVNEAQPELRRPKHEAIPTPKPLFSIKRPAALREDASPSKAKPLTRLFSDSTPPVQRERTSLTEPAPLSRSLGTRRAGLLSIEREILPQFKDEKDVIEQDDALEEAAAEEFVGEAIEFTIEGPASGRKVSYKPLQLPEVAIEMEVDIRLKFWVLPDGSVGEVVPLQRGDVRLERAAIQYLKSWRFTPVADEREVWGIIPIRYKLR